MGTPQFAPVNLEALKLFCSLTGQERKALLEVLRAMRAEMVYLRLQRAAQPMLSITLN